jgi:ABC-type transport system substrate-binding protein
MADADLQKVRGFATDAAAARDSAKKLLADAGVSSLSFTLVTPAGDAPYGPLVEFLIDQWKQAGITVTRDARPQYAASIASGDYQVALDLACSPLDEPDIQLARFKGGYGDAKLDGMIDAQSRETDVNKRIAAVADVQRYILDEKAYAFPALWWYRVVPYLRSLRGWRIASGDGNGEDLATAWLMP